MQAYKQMFWIVFGILAIVLAPLIGAQVHFGGQFPENYFHFPLTEAPVKPGFLSFGIFLRYLRQCL